jgi:hypothetical protein
MNTRILSKNLIRVIGMCILISLFTVSCSRGSGCPSETAAGNVDKRGNLKTTSGKSNLFPKDTQKKMRKN